MHRCFAEDVWLPPLADRFVRLALQLLARYATWLRAGLAARSAATSAAAAGAPAQQQVGIPTHSRKILLPHISCCHLTNHAPGCCLPPQHGADAMHVLVPNQDSAGGGWAVGARADALCTVRADTDAVLAWARAELWAQLAPLLASLPPEVLRMGGRLPLPVLASACTSTFLFLLFSESSRLLARKTCQLLGKTGTKRGVSALLCCAGAARCAGRAGGRVRGCG